MKSTSFGHFNAFNHALLGRLEGGRYPLPWCGWVSSGFPGKNGNYWRSISAITPTGTPTGKTLGMRGGLFKSKTIGRSSWSHWSGPCPGALSSQAISLSFTVTMGITPSFSKWTLGSIEKNRERSLNLSVNWLVCKHICLPEKIEIVAKFEGNSGLTTQRGDVGGTAGSRH